MKSSEPRTTTIDGRRPCDRSCAMAATLVAAVILLGGCESVRPNTVKNTGTRLGEATKPTLLDGLSWQGWPGVLISEPENVAVNPHNWGGMRDCSAQVGVDVYGDRLTVAGQVMDDHPLEQPFERAQRPAWWKIPVAGDAIEVVFTPRVDRGGVVRVLLEFGSDGTRPRFFVLEAPKGQLGEVPRAVVGRVQTPLGYEFVVRCTDMDTYGLRPLWTIPYEIQVKIHDYDTDPTQYQMLEGSVTTEARQ